MQLTAAEPPATTGQHNATLEHIARQRIAAWWDRAGIEPSYPADDRTAVKLVNAVDYLLTLEDLIRFIDVGAFAGVSFSYGQRHWSATDIARLSFFLEFRRAWKPGSELHHAKKTCYERTLETFRATGEGHEMFGDLEKYDLRSLLVMLTEAENRQQREALFAAVQLKLESYMIVV